MDKNQFKTFNIGIAAEMAPGKTLIPIIKKLKELEENKKLKWEKTNIIGLSHGENTQQLLEPFCSEIYPIGKGRSREKKKSNLNLAYLIFKDTLKAINALRGKNIDLLITCGNAGDVRKSIAAGNLLNIPILHIEQDIYNPIELISLANIVTAPSEHHVKYLKESYSLKNVKNIGGYPMAVYVNNYILDGNLKDKDEIYDEYNINREDFDEFVLYVLGGDLKPSDLEKLIASIFELDFPAIVVPYRFDKKDIEDLILIAKHQHKYNKTDGETQDKNQEYENKVPADEKFPKNIKILDGFVDLLSLMKISTAIVYGAGMGITIEAGVLKIPSVKIAGFHREHGSVDLSKTLNIPIVEIEDIPEAVKSVKEPKGDLVENGTIAIDHVADLIANFDFDLKKSGFKSMKAIWKKRSEFR